MWEDFLKNQIEYEVIQPGIILGAVELICRGCGVASTHESNADGSCRFVCPVCDMANDV